ncbi:MAG: Na(+)-translocating NADH-quinone reductase subunit C [Planctomycetaceae bacterium]
MQRDSIQNTFRVAILLCLVCSVLVSAMAVGLRPIQQRQKQEFKQKSILKAAGLWTDEDESDSAADVSEFYNRFITPVIVDLETNTSSERFEPTDPDLDAERAARSNELSDALPAGMDPAGIRRREKYSIVYEVRDNGELRTLVIPIRGYGLWSTLWGFIALDVQNAVGDPSKISVVGITYYKHGETPGLGGEVENPLWREKWVGKKIYDPNWNVEIEVAKGASGDYQVDALSGATLTSNGVSNMLSFWFGPEGFGPYLKNLLGTAQAGIGSSAEQSPAH